MKSISYFYDISNPSIISHVIITCIVAGLIILGLQQLLFRYMDKKKKDKETAALKDFEQVIENAKNEFDLKKTLPEKQEVIGFFVSQGLELEKKSIEAGNSAFAALISIKVSRIENLLSTLVLIEMKQDGLKNDEKKE